MRTRHPLPVIEVRTAKKRKTAEQAKFHCTSCDTDRVSSVFPDYNPSAECEHLINTCKTCLKKWVESCVEAGSLAVAGEGKVFGVRCPECEAVMRNVNVELAATKKVHQKFEELERKHIGDTTPGWRWCLNPSCKAGQVHETPAPAPGDVAPKRAERRRASTKPTAKPVAEPDICTCHACGSQACVPCDRPWHAGETCADYQARIQDRVAEEDQSLAQIRKLTKPCPTCRKNIEKNGGCPAMHCTQCGVGFCWNCTATRDEQGMCLCYKGRQAARTERGY